MALKLLSSDDYSKTFELPGGITVRLVLEEDLSKVEGFDGNAKSIGYLEFCEIENEHQSYHKLTWAYLDHSGDAYTRPTLPGRHWVEVVVLGRRLRLNSSSDHSSNPVQSIQSLGSIDRSTA
jgi:hypothetical protein